MLQSHQKNHYDVLIIGGGIYGCIIALTLKKYFKSICIVEEASSIMTRATYVNQARIHNGYHYPRNFLTALRSHANYSRFLHEYRECVDNNYQSIYAIARHNSKTSSQQFITTCKLLEIPIKKASMSIHQYFNPTFIEEVFITEEAVFNVKKMKHLIKKRLRNAQVDVINNSSVTTISKSYSNISITTLQKQTFTAKYVFNCSYSRINTILKKSNIPLLSFKHELTEMLLVEMPVELHDIGITVMDGPFFSTLPFPSSNGLYSLSHVRYTPHLSWNDENEFQDSNKVLASAKNRHSRFQYVLKDAQRYIPILKKARYMRSLFEIKTLLLENEYNDGRPILFRRDYGIPNFYVVMGGKIDNIYDIETKIDELFKDYRSQ